VFDVVDADGNIPFQKKIKFIVVVGMFFHLAAEPVLVGIVVIIDFKIL
jgi:hypothetical protein